MAVNKYIGGGLEHGQFKDSSGDVYDVEAVVTAGGTVSQSDIEIIGDDERKGSFATNRIEELSITANAITFDQLQAITNNTVDSDSEGAEIALGTDTEMNPPFVEFSAETQAKNVDEETEATITKTWHKVQINAVEITQEGESEMTVEMTGVAIQTDTDIEGESLDSKRVATISVVED